MRSERVYKTVSVMAEEPNLDVVSAYTELAYNKILHLLYPFAEAEDHDLPEEYTAVLIEAAVYLLSKRGMEGQLSHSENGVVLTYGSDDLPLYLTSQIVPYVGVIK